MGMIHVNGLT